MTIAPPPATSSGRRISIDPITRLEGHGKIDIFLDAEGNVADCFLQVPELRGFEKFCEGRPVEEMPRITPRICGVCPEAHLMASAKACDAVYKVSLPLTARLIRELQYDIFYVTDHATHFYALAAPDFVMGPTSDPAERNLIGVIRKLGVEVGRKVIQARKWGHEAASIFGGRPVNPENAIPGGVSKPITAQERDRLEEIARAMVDFSRFTLVVLREQVLANPQYVDLILNGPYCHRTYSMGLVDDKNRTNFYDGKVRVVDPDGHELCKYAPRDYAKHIAERVEPWTYLKFPYLTQVGWRGFVDGKQSGVYRATPQARLNVADSMSTPLAQEAYEGPPDAGHPLGARHRDDQRGRARRRAGAPSRTHASGELPDDPPRHADRGRRHRRGPAWHAGAPLRHRRERPGPQGQPGRGDDEQPRRHLHVDQAGGAGPDHARERGHRGRAEHDRDGLPRLRPLLRLCHAQPAGPDADGRAREGSGRDGGPGRTPGVGRGFSLA